MYDPNKDYIGDCEYCEYCEVDDLDESNDIYFCDDENLNREWQRFFLKNPLADFIRQNAVFDTDENYGRTRIYIKENNGNPSRIKVQEWHFLIDLDNGIQMTKMLIEHNEFGEPCNEDWSEYKTITKKTQLTMLKD